MIKKLFKFILFLSYLFLLLVAVSLFLPSKYAIEREIVINGTTEEIYQIVATPKTYHEWSSWNTENYPEMKSSFEGPETGVGAISKWTDPKIGNGQMTIVKADPKTGIETILLFETCENPFHGKFSFEDLGDGKIKVTWSGKGENGVNPIHRYFGFAMEYMLGPEYEEGLKGLKQKVESSHKKNDGEGETI